MLNLWIPPSTGQTAKQTKKLNLTNSKGCGQCPLFFREICTLVNIAAVKIMQISKQLREQFDSPMHSDRDPALLTGERAPSRDPAIAAAHGVMLGRSSATLTPVTLPKMQGYCQTPRAVDRIAAAGLQKMELCLPHRHTARNPATQTFWGFLHHSPGWPQRMRLCRQCACRPVVAVSPAAPPATVTQGDQAIICSRGRNRSHGRTFRQVPFGARKASPVGMRCPSSTPLPVAVPAFAPVLPFCPCAG